MLTRVYTGLFLILCCEILQSKSLYDEAEHRALFIMEFLALQANTKQIIIHFCRDQGFIVRFSQMLSAGLSPHAFINDLEDLKKYEQRERLLLVLELQCADSLDFLFKASILQLFGVSNHWLIFDTPDSSLTSSVYLPVNSKIFLAEPVGPGFSVKTIFKYSPADKEFTENNIGRWTRNGGFKYYNKLSLPTDRLNLMGTPMKVSYYYTFVESINHTTDFRERENDNSMKLNYMILNAVADFLNATYITNFTSNFGLSFDEKTQLYEDNSMMGDVQRGKADIMGLTGWIEDTRLLFFRFFGPTTPDYIMLLFRAPPIPLQQNVYLLPFDESSWYGIGFVMLTGIVVLLIIQIQKHHLRDEATFVDVIMIFLSALLQKSWEVPFNSYSSRLSLAITYLSFLVIFNAYSASIIVYLQKTSERIKTFEDLYEAHFDFAVHDVSYNYFYFMGPNNRTNEYWRQKIFREKIEGRFHNFFLPIEKGVERMNNDLFAFQCQLSLAHFIIDKIFTQSEKCTVRYAPPIYQSGDFYIAALKNSSYFLHYRVGMRKMFENGLHKRAFARLFKLKLPCEGNISYYNGIGLTEMRFIFVVFIAGVVTSLVILILEILLVRFQNTLIYFKLLRRTHIVYPYTE